jgi:hypothetical protein
MMVRGHDLTAPEMAAEGLRCRPYGGFMHEIVAFAVTTSRAAAHARPSPRLTVLP